MAISDWLVHLGVRAEQIAQGSATRSGALPLQWPAGNSASLIYRLPRDPSARASLFSTQQTIIVQEGQAAVVLEDGVSNGTLPPGKYAFEKARVVGSLDVVWVRTSQQPIKWGLGNADTLDGIEISANGELFARVVDAEVFNREVVQGAITLAERDLQRRLVPRISRVLTQCIARTEASDIQLQQDEFEAQVKDRLSARLHEMGLGIVSFEVANLHFPPEFKAARSGERMAQLNARRQMVEAQTAAQITQMEAGAAAQARLLEGMAEVQLMQAMQSQGLDPLRIQAMEAMKLLAQNEGGAGDVTGVGAAARTALIGQLAAGALAGGVPDMRPMPPPAPPQIPATPAPAPVGKSNEDKITEIEDKIDALGDQLAAGEITESSYDKLVARLERRLDRLTGG